MTPETPDLPDPAVWPLQVFFFVRRIPGRSSDPSALTATKDLKYYLRVMRGPHWKFTVPLCVNEATETDVEVLETALAYMETAPCQLWLHPMEYWKRTRVFLIAVHAWACEDPRVRHRDCQTLRDLIPHITPHERHVRDGQVPDMIPTLGGLARLYKESLPMEIFHYRPMFHGEHVRAVARIFGETVWRDAATQFDGTDEGSSSSQDLGDEWDKNDSSKLVEVYRSDVHSAEDPREATTIVVSAASLPSISSPGILLQIPLPIPLAWERGDIVI